METYNLTYKRLIENGFIRANIDLLNEKDVLFFQKGHVNILLKKIYNIEALNNILDEALVIRKVLLDHSCNVWNTYLVICIDCEFDNDDIYLTERDTRAIRKYVIKCEQDLNRIPYLDHIKDEKTPNPIKIINDKDSDNQIIKELVGFFIENQGEKLDLAKTSLITRKVLGMVNINED
ncbi:ABC-three component system middle component 1 [Anaerospora hongkongensis]|uniref:ABC-three component system middle component 1 n=1 Tax=Anaerospora hongkongensis TaxID=244830 RepID=UPI00289CF563|nr:ABC-three component system middle component 1 [Anaerospora hongkongensis]